MTDQLGPDSLGQAIPIPTVRTETFAWHKRDWPDQAIWPAKLARFPPLHFATHLLFGAYLIVFLLVTDVLVSQLVVEADRQAPHTGLLAFSLVAISVSLVAMLLRRGGRARGLARVLMFCFGVVAVGGLGMASVFATAVSPPTMEQHDLIAFLPNSQVYGLAIATTVLTITVWFLVDADARRFERLRESVRRATSVVLPNMVWMRVNGRPGGPPRTDAGARERRSMIAEQLTAPLLNELLTIPAVAIVHRITFPGDPGLHIGHAVVAGNRIALIDSVLWEPGEYALDSWGRVLRNGAIDEGVTVALPIAAERFAAALPSTPIRSWVVAHRLSEGTLTATSDEHSAVRLVTPEAMLREVGDWLSEQGNQVDPFTHEFVLRQHME